MMKVFIYPQHKKKQTINPYLENQEWAVGKQFEIVHPEYRRRLPQSLRLLIGSTKADVYILNWIEEAVEGEGSRLLRGLWTLLALQIIMLRKAKIVWIFHNIHSHERETFWSKQIKQLLFRGSTIIVAHSAEACEYAKQYARCPVHFKNHPIPINNYGMWGGELKECDFYIWGNIHPYKGVLEFLSNPLCRESGKQILVVGRCKDKGMSQEIIKCCNEKVVFENRQAGFSEIAAQCKKAKYVLFPYVGDSISSSGVLMDTLQMGGTPVGPNRGAFADLAREKCCIVYDDIKEVFDLPVNEKKMTILQESRDRFMKDNSWEAFGAWLYNILKEEHK